MLTAEGKQLTKTVAEGTLLFSVTNVVQKGTGVLSALLLANGLAVYAFGLLKLAQSTVSFANAFFFSGINSVVIAETARATGTGDRDLARRLLWQYAKTELALGAATTAVYALTAPLLARLWAPGWFTIILFGAPLIFLGCLRMITAVLLQINLRFRLLAILKIFESVFALASLGISIFFLNASVQAVIAGYVVAQALALAAIAPPVIKIVAEFWGAPGEYLLLGLVKRQGIWAIAGDYLKTFSDNARLWLLAALAGVEAVAVYSLADALIGHTTSLFPLSQTLLPVVSREVGDHDRMRRVFVRIVKYHLAVFLALGVLGFTVFPFFLHLLFPKYDRSIPLYLIMLLSMPVFAVSIALNVYLTSYRMQRPLFKLVAARAGYSLALLAALGALFGALGAALESVVTSAIFMATRLSALWKQEPALRFSIREIFRFDDFDRELIRTALTRFRRLRHRGSPPPRG